MEISVNIPDYFTVKHYKDFSILKSLDEMEQRLFVISALTGESMETVKSWPATFSIQLYARLNELINGVQPEFYPVIEWNNKQYGFRPIHKMTLSEYVDFDNLAKDTDKNINDILALIYRPITKNKLNSATFITKSTFKVLSGTPENGFDYYEIEDYDNELRKDKAKEFDSFPASVALGALGFFLGSTTLLSSSTPSYSLMLGLKTNDPKMKKSKIKTALALIMAGYSSSMNLLKVPSYQSMVTNV